MSINIISDVPETFWTKQVKTDSRNSFKFIFTSQPVPADYHLVYGKYVNFDFQVSKPKVWFYCSEPPEIHKFRRSYLKQFGIVAGPQFHYIMKLANFLNTFPVYPLHVGQQFASMSNNSQLVFEKISKLPSPFLNEISIIMSNKKITLTQRDRIKFLNEIKDELSPILKIFGRDVSPIDDKLEVLSKLRYHIAIENANHKDYFTEKLTDAIVSRNVVFYSGASNIHDFFDPKSVISIDIKNAKDSIRTIRDTILDTNYYSQSLESINGNISKVMNDFTIFSLGSFLINRTIQMKNLNDEYFKVSSELSAADKIKLFLSKVVGKLILLK